MAEEDTSFSIGTVILFSIPVVAALLLLSWYLGQTKLKKQVTLASTQQMKLLTFAIIMYKDSYGHLPKQTSGPVDFAEQLSKIPASDSQWLGPRPMFVDYEKHNFHVSNSKYAEVSATATTIFDPCETPYRFEYKNNSNSFSLISAGLDKIFGTPDDIKSKDF